MEKLIRVPPPVVAATLLALGYGLGQLLPGLPTLALPTAGIVLVGSGVALAATAFLEFRRRRTTFIPLGEPSALVMQGAYTWTRNPMYLGLLSVTVGVALLVGTLPLLLAPVAFHKLIGLAHIRYEEEKLAGLFGERYVQYRQRVPRWL